MFIMKDMNNTFADRIDVENKQEASSKKQSVLNFSTEVSSEKTTCP